MLTEAMNWILVFSITIFLFGAIFGPRIIRALITLLRYFVSPNFLELEGYLLNKDNRARIKKTRHFKHKFKT